MFQHQAGFGELKNRMETIKLRPGKMNEMVVEGKTVFVDVTADWCITCKANKALVIDRGQMAAQLRGDDVVAMQGDWSLLDERISAYLASYGRYGLPFDAVYGPGAPEGIVLPELSPCYKLWTELGRPLKLACDEV
jgi:suppressor for copper-sensitivity B